MLLSDSEPENDRQGRQVTTAPGPLSSVSQFLNFLLLKTAKSVPRSNLHHLRRRSDSLWAFLSVGGPRLLRLIRHTSAARGS